MEKQTMTAEQVKHVVQYGAELGDCAPVAGKSYDGTRNGVVLYGMFYGNYIEALTVILRSLKRQQVEALGPVQGPVEAPAPFNACEGEEDGTELYMAEMGFNAEERAEYLRRTAEEAAFDEEQARYTPKPMACGCTSHEEGGPGDYPAKCRRNGRA